MSDSTIPSVEDGLRACVVRGALLASDAANAHTPNFTPADLVPVSRDGLASANFGYALERVQTQNAGAAIEAVMAATAENSIRFRSLADQEHAMLREFRTVAEELRR
ncbi:MAG TPA: hypothetical protein VEJ20_02200 [Candidatus Eremiobacteraceae bacterium]|nr:hypothetical protein [Candidatus Eremiobacteraceae bacterium]